MEAVVSLELLRSLGHWEKNAFARDAANHAHDMTVAAFHPNLPILESGPGKKQVGIRRVVHVFVHSTLDVIEHHKGTKGLVGEGITQEQGEALKGLREHPARTAQTRDATLSVGSAEEGLTATLLRGRICHCCRMRCFVFKQAGQSFSIMFPKLTRIGLL